MKVSELTGAELDYWVGKAEGVKILLVDDMVLADRGTAENYAYHYTPSTDWSQGGLIIERERIELRVNFGGAQWAAMGNGFYAEGPTPLIAAMRAYVASKFGDEVDDAQAGGKS